VSSSWTVSTWGLENLQLQKTPCPDPGPGEVKVALRAAALNYRDLLVVEGKYNPRFPLPLVPCSDAMGEIVEVGSGVSSGLLKKSVLTLFCPQWHAGDAQRSALRNTLGGPLPGVLSQFRIYRPEELFVLPEPSALTPEEWATLPCAGVTAWNCLIDQAQLRAGQSVLLIGTGGVSLFGLQIAKVSGAKCLLLSSSAEKRERALELGADAVADYRANPNWSEWVLQQTNGKGVDVVLETGGAGTLPQSIKSTKVGGHISLIGVLSGAEDNLNILGLIMKGLTVRGAVVGSKAHLQSLHDAILHTMTRPVVQKSYSWDEVPKAFEALSCGGHFGKITIALPSV